MTPAMERRATLEFWSALAALTLIYLAAVTVGNRRFVWFDELFTFNIAGSATAGQVWYRELHFDCSPPTLYFPSRATMAIFGHTPLGLRLPAMVEFYLGSVVAMVYLRRKAGTAFSVLGVLLLWTVAPTLYYAVEARPYALVFAAFCCLLLAWDTATRSAPRGWALAGVALASIALITAHIFSVFTFIVFLIAEFARFLRRRRADYPLWTALLLPMAAGLLYLPFLPSCSGIIFPAHASYNTILIFLEETLASPLLAIVVLMLLIFPPGQDAGIPRIRFAAEDKALLAALLFSPWLLSLFLMTRKALFYSRYSTATQVAMMLAFVILLSHRLPVRRGAAYAASVVLLLSLLKTAIWHPLRYPEARNAAFFSAIYPELPLVATEGRTFMEMNSHESPALLSRLVFLHDPPASLKYLHTNIFQGFESPEVMKQAGYPIAGNIEPYDAFVHRHHEFLLLGTPTQWAFMKLRDAGASFRLLGDYRDRIPYIDTTLYLVEVSGQ